MGTQGKVGLNDHWAKSLTDDRLVDDLRKLAGDASFGNPGANAARLLEAARRLEEGAAKPPRQFIVTCEDGRQIGFMHGQFFVRSQVAYVWPAPLSEATVPHRPGSWYRGEW